MINVSIWRSSSDSPQVLSPVPTSHIHHRTVKASNEPRRQGFALVLALGLMAFVLTLMLGVAAILRVETSSADRQVERLQAKCNALLGLQIAVGQLQQMTGPDRRVTASAEATEGENAIASAEWAVEWAEKNPQWVGVWKDGRDLAELVDPELSPRDPVFEGWLVSSPPGTDPDPKDPLNLEDSVVLLSQQGAGGVVQDPILNAAVHAPWVSIEQDELRTSRFAYWVSDEGVKARVDLEDTVDYSVAGTAEKKRIWSLRSPQRNDWQLLKYFEGIDSEPEEVAANLERSASLEGLEIWSSLAAVKPSFHDFTTDGVGLITDARYGGFRWDLTYFLAQSEGSVPLDATDLIGTASEELSVTDLDNMAIVPPSHEIRVSRIRQLVNPTLSVGSEGSLEMDILPPGSDGEGMHPVLAGSSMYVDFTRSATTNTLLLNIFPTFLIWNPYDVAIKERDYVITQALDYDFYFALRGVFALPNGSVFTQTVNTPYGINPWDLNDEPGGLGGDRRATFNVPDLTLQPGEVVILTPTDFNVTFDGDDEANFLEANPPDAWNNEHNFVVDTGYALPTWTTEFDIRFRYAESGDPTGGGTHYIRPQLYSLTEDGEREPVLTDMRLFFRDCPSRKPTAPEDFVENNDHATWGLPWWELNSSDEGVSRGRIPNYGNTNPDEYDLAAFVRGPFNSQILDVSYNSQFGKSLAIRFLADYNLRHWNHFRSDAERAGGGSLFTAVPTINRHQHTGEATSSVLTDNFASPQHPRNFLGPFFEAFRSEQELLSIGQLQHLNWGPEIYFPAYPVGNSLASPLSARHQVHSTHSASEFDLSYYLNEALWDRFYFSTVPQHDSFAVGPDLRLPNSRYRVLLDSDGNYPETEDLRSGLKEAAQHLGIVGAFNVNSTRVEAWKALLGSVRGVQVPLADSTTEDPGADGYPHPFPRLSRSSLSDPNIMGAPSHAHLRSYDYLDEDTRNPNAYTGYRALSDAELELLAIEIVEQVRRRGPFLSLADFVNRRLVADDAPDSELGLMGALQAAINGAGINDGFDDEYVYADETTAEASDELEPEITARAIAEHRAGAKGTNLPGYLTQADVLQSLGPVLSARSDTFKIRVSGSSVTTLGTENRVYLEAVVQRMPETLDPTTFTRPYRIVSLRWIGKNDV